MGFVVHICGQHGNVQDVGQEISDVLFAGVKYFERVGFGFVTNARIFLVRRLNAWINATGHGTI